MKIWIITDTHFGHDKMMEYCGRPQDFSIRIIKNLARMQLSGADLLIHLGDFCIGNDKDWHKRVLEGITVKKWLVKGNHDKKSNAWYLANGWDWVGEKFQDRYFGKQVLFSHMPQKDTGYFDLNIHGHFHNNLHRLLEGRYVVKGEKERNEINLANLTPKHRLLAIENTYYQPVLLESFINSNPISKGKK